ncbi:sensor domain-containing protein [Mycobacterium sp. SMC-4]|uniref:sensor domain-containing protein n=1 Tax=Mycobacterium sp. SMC-4 TaxID=2857059 RepID=UPI003D02ED7A
MGQPETVLGFALICALVAGCGSSIGNAESTTPTRTVIPRPLVERELPELLLTPAEIDQEMGTAGMALTGSATTLSDTSASMAPRECLAVDAAGEALVYADSGYRASHDESFNNGDDFTHYLKQTVVLFPLVEKAQEFFDASAQQWPACRQYTHLQSGTEWTPGPVANADGMLSVVAMQQDARAGGWGCGRALAVRNNVIVDVNACAAKPADSAVRIAKRIADNVSAQW